MPNINDYGLPFTSQDGDRKYSALEWREYFSRLIHNGLIQNAANECQVKPQAVPNKTVYVDTGVVFINGAMRVLEEPVTLAVTENPSGNPRIDRVVARLNEASRTIEFAVLEGTPAGSPVAPDLTRAAGVYELGLADITIANGYSTITSGVISDKRWDISLCGASSMTIGVIPPSGLAVESIGVSKEFTRLWGLGETATTLDKLLTQLRLYNSYEPKSNIEYITTSGTWVCPQGVESVDLYILNGGAQGGRGATNSYYGGGGGGEGGGAMSIVSYPVTPGQSYSVIVGGANSGLSSFDGMGIKLPAVAGQGLGDSHGGGLGGSSYFASGGRGGGNNSTYSNDAKRGDDPIYGPFQRGAYCFIDGNVYGGGGGGGKGSSSTPPAGLGFNGGGNGGAVNTVGENATGYGGGGGGGGATNGRAGGNGYQGVVIIAYDICL